MTALNRRVMGSVRLSLNNKQCRRNGEVPSEVIPAQLFLGNIHHALNLSVLKSLRITHIVNCTQSIANKFAAQGMTYCRVPVNDKSAESIMHYFVQAIRFIVLAMKDEKARVLVHCHAGISRSATITIAYLMFAWKLTMFDALTHLQSKRYIITPNQGFKNQLLDFYLYLEANE